MSELFLERVVNDEFEVTLEEIPALIFKLAAVQCSLSARLLRKNGDDKAPRRHDAEQLLDVSERAKNKHDEEDRLLSAKEAAERLGVTTDYLYRNKDLPFRIRLPNSSKALFSSLGIDGYLKSQRRT